MRSIQVECAPELVVSAGADLGCRAAATVRLQSNLQLGPREAVVMADDGGNTEAGHPEAGEWPDLHYRVEQWTMVSRAT